MFIFDNIVKNEVTFTELIRNLCGFTVFRREFTEWVLASCGGVDDKIRAKFTFDFDQITTQVVSDPDPSAENNGRPDIILDNGAIRIVLELKVDPARALTGNQPKGYLDELSSSSGYAYQMLAFVVPRGYQHAKSIHDQETEWRSVHDDSALPGKIPILYWQDFTDRLRSRGMDEISFLLRHFIELAEDWFPDTRIAVSDAGREILGDRALAEALQGAYQLVDDVRDFLKSEERIVVSPRRAHDYDYSVTFRDALDGGVTGYFGFGFGDFEGGRPFLIGVSSNRETELRRRQTEGPKLPLGEPYSQADMVYFPLVPNAFDSDKRLATILETLSAGTGIEFHQHDSSNYASSDYTGWQYKMLYHEHGQSRFGATFNAMVTAVENVSTALKVRYDARTSRANDFNQYSVYASIPGDTGQTREFVFGLFYHNWKDEGLALWVGTAKDRKKRLRANSRLTGNGFEEGDNFYRAVDLSAGTVVAAGDKDIVEHIIEIARDLLNP